jgi:hypothetical protein
VEERADAAPLTALAAPSEYVALRESARETLEANCADCHTKGRSTALARALRVFDLTETDFAARMTEEQLREANRRLNQPLAPTRGEGEARTILASPEAKAKLARFVEAELARRRDAP